MLSIVKMEKGSLGYYTDLAREDYYLNGGEPQGLWAGRGSEALGLPELVTRAHFRSIFQGFAPDSDIKLRQSAGSDGHIGQDLTFSAPKSVSVFWALSDDHTRARIERAVIKAAREALRYLEKEALYTRRGKGGCVIEKGAGMISALFLHGTSREQDPQLHVHCPTANLVHRTDGTWGTMLGITSKDRGKDFRKTRLPFYREKMAAGALFRASLAAWLEKDLGLSIRRQGTSFEIDGIPKALLDRFSTRRHQIEEELAAVGATDAQSAKRAALVTRRRKTHVPREQLFRKWRAQAAGFDLSALKRVTTHRDQAKESEEALAGAQARLQSAQPPPSKPQFVRRLAEEAQGRGLDAGAVLAVIERIFRQPPRHPGDRDADRAVKVATTILKRSARSRRHALGIANVLLAVKQTEFLRGRMFSPDERKALTRITRTRGSIQVLPTGPETSNTDVLKTARLAWERAGFKVLLASPSSGAKEFWEEQTGVHSISLRGLVQGLTTNRGLIRGYDSALKKSWEAHGLKGFHSKKSFLKFAIKAAGKWIRFDDKTVLVLDDPRAIPLHVLTNIMKRAHKARTKVVFLDEAPRAEKQETATEVLSRILGAKQVKAELDHIVRQQKREGEPEQERTY